MFRFLSRLNPFSVTKHRGAQAMAVRLPLRGKYDAAQTTADNRRHWSMADSLSAAQANSLSVRRILRNRARYEYANNTYCKGIIDTLANDVIGYGTTLRLDTGNPATDLRIKRAWNTWCKQTKLAAKLRTMRIAKARDGEAFAVLTTNQRLPGQIKLDLRLVEADQVTDPTDDTNHADGIRFDADGNPVSYMIQPYHPGDGRSSLNPAVVGDTKPTPAESVIHWFSPDRPGQVRGIPEITAALPLFAQLRRYTLAVVAAAETAAEFAAVMQTRMPADGTAAEVDPFLPIEIEQRTMLSIPEGWELSQLKAEQPTSTYAEFKRELINEIARCVNMPFNIAACNSAGYNYSSGQLDHQTYFSAIEVDQDQCVIDVLDRILKAWLEEAALVPGLLPPGPYGDWIGTTEFLFSSRGHADPTKMANAQATRLANHTTTLANEYARDGLNWEEQLRQRAKELQLLRELDLPDPNAPANNDQPDGDEDFESTDAEREEAQR